MIFNADGKIFYISDTVCDYLGNSAVRLCLSLCLFLSPSLCVCVSVSRLDSTDEWWGWGEGGDGVKFLLTLQHDVKMVRGGSILTQILTYVRTIRSRPRPFRRCRAISAVL